MPKLNAKGVIKLNKARHPLIDPKKVVATDIYLGKDFDTLIITGPNTGGKTVTLKTLGLLSLMAQSGLYIPADDGSGIKPVSIIEQKVDENGAAIEIVVDNNGIKGGVIAKAVNDQSDVLFTS